MKALKVNKFDGFKNFKNLVESQMVQGKTLIVKLKADITDEERVCLKIFLGSLLGVERVTEK